MTTVVFVALVWKIIDFLRLCTNWKVQKSAVITQLCAWVGGVVVVAIAAQAQVTQGLVLPGSDLPLGKLDWVSWVLLGLLVSSAASSVVDLKQAFDRTDSAAKPPLVPSAGTGCSPTVPPAS
jgi:hypothetical protein